MKFDWIFFDCFNTLLDDFADEAGLCGIPRKVVEWGLFPSEAAFRDTYLISMRRLGPDWTEVTLRERLRYCVQEASQGQLSRSAAVEAMMECWEHEYPKILHPTPGVEEMLAHWHGRVQLGVVSNFFMPGWPARYLESHGLGKYFDFVLDSATFGRKKPHRLIFERALKLAGKDMSHAGRILFIGDRVDLDVDPPRALGMQVIHFNRSNVRPEVAATPNGVRSIRSWDEFRS